MGYSNYYSNNYAFGKSKARRYRKRRYYRRKRSSGITTSQALLHLGAKGVTMLKSMLGLNTQMNWLDTIETNVGIGSTCAAIANPLVIPIGDSCNTRTGNQIRLVSYRCKGRIQANTAATTGCLVRLFFVKFSDVRGGNPAAASFLDSTSRITTAYQMGDNINAAGFSVVYDRTFSIPINGQTGDTQYFEFDFTPVNFKLKWDSSDTAGAITSLLTNQIRGYIMTSETGANTPNYWADHRVRFVDN